MQLRAEFPSTTFTWLMVLLAVFILGMTTGWQLSKPEAAQPETYATARVQADGSTILERKPDATAKPAHMIPAGAKVTRLVQMTVKPKHVAQTDHAAPVTPQLPTDPIQPAIKPEEFLAAADCPPVTVDLSLVRDGAGGSRVIASSPDGDILAGIDTPVESPPMQRKQRWAISYLRTFDNKQGGQVQYQRGPFIVGAGALPGTGFVSAGIRF